ncbi:HvfC/BufC family peptide modification chaperone [Burkholderia sp. AW33-5]
MRSENRVDDYASAFVRGLINPMIAAADDVTAGSGKATGNRYNVYRNNVTVSLIDALAAIYPAVQRITGVEFFRAMARFYVRETPPSSPLLFEYGRDFPTFIESYEFARPMPWLADTARIERAWLDAYHAADTPALSAATLTGIDAASLMKIRFIPHPAARVIRSNYPAVAIFAMNKADEPVTPLSSSEPEDALITRPQHEVIVSRLPAGATTFLTCLIEGVSLGEAVTTTFKENSSFDLPANLTGMITAGVFTAVRHGD